MNRKIVLNFICGTALALMFVPQTMKAQITTGVSSVTLNASLAESLSISLTGATTVNFTLAAGSTAAGSATVPIQTSWVLHPSRTAVHLVGYFDTTDALTHTTAPTTKINVAQVEGRVSTGTPTTFTAFTGATLGGIGTAGASLGLFSETIIGTNKTKTRTDTLELQINLTAAPQQPAGDYTGTLRIRAVAI